MIEVLKKRYIIGDTITLHTSEASFTGVIDAFENTCVILITENGEEFIDNNAIKRISVPKITGESRGESNNTFEIERNKTIEIKTTSNEKTNNTINIIKSPMPEYKAGDVIPLDILEKRSGKNQEILKQALQEKLTYKIDSQPILTDKTIGTNKLANDIQLSKIEKKNSKKIAVNGNQNVVLNSLSALSKVFLPENEEENQKVVAANGTINRYWADKKFGFIIDMWNTEVFFHFHDIIDTSLLSIVNVTNKKYVNIPIIFILVKRVHGDKALFIQKPKKIIELIKISKEYCAKEMYDIANGILDEILFAFPQNRMASALREEINSSILSKNNSYDKKKYLKSFDLNFKKATKAKNIDKNSEEALRLYLIAFENREKRESCIKEIPMLYLNMGYSEKAIEFIDKYEHELPDNLSSYYYLENFYFSAKEFEKCCTYIDLILGQTNKRERVKYAYYLSKQGFALIQLNELNEAREVLEEAVKIRPENTYASRLLKALDESDNEELIQVIADAEFDSFGGSLSKLVRDTLENYEEYFGVPPKVIDTGDFKKEDLHGIRRLIETAGKARPRERAYYLLTEAKLMTLLEQHKDIPLRSVLARYCNAMALNHISENSSMDVIRSFYLEAFSLEESWHALATQVSGYLLSYKSSYSELISITSKTKPIEEALEYLFNADIKDVIWEGILSMFLWNRSISAQVIGKLFENSEYKNKSIGFLKSIGIDTVNNSSINDYTNIWNQAREKRQRDYSRWLASIKAIYSNESLETLSNQLFDSLHEAKKSWLSQLDTSRLNIINTDILEVIHQYLRQSGYRDKERSFNFAKAQIHQLVSEIKEKPTKFSYEGFVPLLEKIDALLEKSFKMIEYASTPKVKVSILGEASVVNLNNQVEFQISIENSKDSSPIRDIKVLLEDHAGVNFIEKNNQYFDSIDGGEHCNLRLTVQVSDTIIKDRATSLNLKCEYKTRNQNEPVFIYEQLSLRMFSEEEFEPIENPYAPIADGGPVTDIKMFYGRDEFIKNRIKSILNADSKQIIIYGQKRSGKSSVLHHLKKGLEDTNNAFCILFSLGLIIKDLNEFTFFHKILSEITKQLRLKKAQGENVPIFICPNEAEFREKYPTNPANGFIELIEEFKIACLALENWANKKLIIMIDEFTYLYTAIRNGTTSDTIMKQWKAITQNENAKFSVVLVGQDVVPSFKNENYAKNAFGVIEDIRLTYLDEIDAKKLIEEPILDKNGNTRFLSNAIDTIIDYTSRNPYYIQIFCARLVDEMNKKKVPLFTENDVKDVADTFIEGSQALAPEKFDNLIRAGEEHDFREFSDESIIKILRQIAVGSKNIGFCSRDNITLNDKVLEDKILNHLIDREVLEIKQGANYKIQVKLFQKWLLIH